MGYEVTMFLGEVTGVDLSADDDRKFFQIAAMVDLCKVDLDDSIGVAEFDGQPIYLYYRKGGDAHEVADCYGKELRAFDPAVLLKAIKKANRRDKYRRYDMAIPLLEAFIAAGFNNPGVVLYGH